MLNFETTTLINSLGPAYTGTSKAETGAEASKTNYGVIYVGTKGTSKVLHIAHDFNFKASGITRISKRHWEKPEMFEVEFDITKLVTATGGTDSFTESGLARLAIVVSLQGSLEATYANAYGRYDKEFIVEFPYVKGKTATDVAKEAAKAANKYGQLVADERNLVCVADGTKVKVTGTSEYQIVKEAAMQVYDPEMYGYECCSKAMFGGYEDAAEGIVIKQGKPGFGTYRHLMKDLFLPTYAHTAWGMPYEEERPIIGANYTEYTITYCAKREGLGGTSAVGQVVYSETTHTFFVLDNGSEDATSNPAVAFDTVLEDIKTDTNFKGEFYTADADYDDKKVTKEEAEATYDDPAAIKALQEKAAAQNKKNSDTLKGKPGKDVLNDGIRVPNAK